jgi:hypothetical protein
MAGFDFITDEDFRTALEIDQKEMHQCAESKAWKAVHVLAGSIIEAVLIDYLIAEGHVARDDGLKMDLGRAIKLAAENGIISDKLSALSSVIKEYRNLIHPGRSIRTRETPSSTSASIAMSLVEMILTEIEGRKRSNYGYTAEQIVSKVERDSSVGAILKHLLKDLNRREMERLLLKVVPEKYMAELEDFFHSERGHVLPTLAFLFRTAYEEADSQLQARVAQQFVRILKEEAEGLVFAYGRAFFRMSDLQHLPAGDSQLVKEHFFARIKSDPSDDDLIRTLSGIGKYLLPGEVSSFVDPLVRMICFSNTENTKHAARERIKEESLEMEEEVNCRLLARLDQWIQMYRLRKDSQRADLVEELKSYIEIPF